MSPAPVFPRPPRTWGRRALLAAALGVLAAAAAPAAAQLPDVAPDTLVKAAFLHKFASFVEWPEPTFAQPLTPLRIGIYGDDRVWRDLQELARDRDRDGRPVIVSRVQPGEPLTGHHILYLKAPAARLAPLLAAVPEGVLTVCDSDGAHPRGSVLSFYLEEGRVRFGASVEAATRQKLRLSARLLAIARTVARLAATRVA